jgi:hypothetical protein
MQGFLSEAVVLPSRIEGKKFSQIDINLCFPWSGFQVFPWAYPEPVVVSILKNSQSVRLPSLLQFMQIAGNDSIVSRLQRGGDSLGIIHRLKIFTQEYLGIHDSIDEFILDERYRSFGEEQDQICEHLNSCFGVKFSSTTIQKRSEPLLETSLKHLMQMDENGTSSLNILGVLNDLSEYRSTWLESQVLMSETDQKMSHEAYILVKNNLRKLFTTIQEIHIPRLRHELPQIMDPYFTDHLLDSYQNFLSLTWVNDLHRRLHSPDFHV